MLIRKNTAHTLFSLPKLATNCFKYGVTIGFTGSVIRKVTNSLGIYKHYGIVYGFDEEGVFWVIENNVNGVECVTLKDFLSSEQLFEIDCLNNHSLSEDILNRAKERTSLNYHPKTNNCEHFKNYCLTGISESNQVVLTELVLECLIIYSEVKMQNSGIDPKKIEIISNYRKLFGLEEIKNVQDSLNKLNERDT
jgi:hypothetical protein